MVVEISEDFPMRQSMHDLHFKFTHLGWHGVAAFAGEIVAHEYSERSLAHMCRRYSACYPLWNKQIAEGANELYTIRSYLSDLFSRRDSMSSDQVTWVDDAFGNLASAIRSGILVL
ncbi:hypothetical protein C4556_02785 [Candidatus Parcubacteria bacterium]|nr:MAG: hypothetical protein C4556_02785 [Candidatus Parcubacteria bacterium]